MQEEKVRELAKCALDLARKAEATSVKIDIPGDKPSERVEITVDRELNRGLVNVEDDGETSPVPVYERVVIKEGARNKPKILLAVPASWLDL